MEQNNITYSPMGQKSEVYLIGTIVDTPSIKRLLNAQENVNETICMLHSLESFVESVKGYFETPVYLWLMQKLSKED